MNEVAAEAIRFCEQVVSPLASEIDLSRSIPGRLVQGMADIGILGATLPRQYGGSDLDPLAYGAVTEALSRACSSARTLLTVHLSLVAQTLLRFGSSHQKNKFLPEMVRGVRLGAFALSEANAGSDTGGITCSYEMVADRYVINGVKRWISFGDIASFFMVFARDERGVTAFLLDRDKHGIRTNPIDHIISGRGSHIAEVEMCNVVADKDDIVGAEHGAAAFVAPYALDQGRYSVAWAGVGLAREALAVMVAYACSRRQFGQPLSEFQLIQGLIANAACKTHAARAMCINVAGHRAKRSQDATALTTMAKHFSATSAVEICNDAIQVHGANGLSTLFAPERLWREARALEIIEGTSQIQQTMISKHVTASPNQLFGYTPPSVIS